MIIVAIVGVIIVIAIALARGATVTPTFSPEYRANVSMSNPHWRVLRRLVFAMTLGRDCIMPVFRATQLEHLQYRHLGRELPIIDVVPLSDHTHAVVTLLRRGGLSGPVNFVLRLSFSFWLFCYGYGLALGLAALRLVREVPSPVALMADAHEALDVIALWLKHSRNY